MATNAELEVKVKEKNTEIEGLKNALITANESIDALKSENEILKSAPVKKEVQLTDVVDFKVMNGLYFGKDFYSTKKTYTDVKKEDYLAIKKEHGQKVFLVAREPEL